MLDKCRGNTHKIFFFVTKFWLFISKAELEASRASFCWFIHQIAAAGAGPGQREESKSPSGFATWMTEAQVLGHLLLLSQVHYHGAGWEEEQPGHELP